MRELSNYGFRGKMRWVLHKKRGAVYGALRNLKTITNRKIQMQQFRKILVGIDFSESSADALRQAVEIANRGEGSVTALHILSQTEVENYQRGFRVPTESMLAACRTQIDQLAEEQVGSDMGVVSDAVIGAPHHELLGRIDQGGFDLLVLGSRGTESDAHEVGFFAAKCVRHAKVPVLLARTGHPAKYKRVVACVDFSESTPEIVETALGIAVDEEAELEVIHAVRPPWEKSAPVMYDFSHLEVNDFKKEYRSVLAGKMAAAVEGVTDNAGITVHTHVIEHWSPERAITGHLRGTHADLAVVGRSGHTGKILKHYLIGTTAERLIHRSPCSVLTVPCHGGARSNLTEPHVPDEV